jgi:alpha-tubulin suppressor-like RCC1 family protein
MSIFITGPIRISGSILVDSGLPPVNVWSFIGTTTSTAAVLSSYGDLYSWGAGSVGLHGNNDTVNRSSPVQIAGSWTKVVGGRFHRLALKSDGSLWSWGSNASGQLGHSTAIGAHRSSPVQIGTSSWTNIACNTNTSYAVRSDGTLWAWGSNFYSEQGTGDSVHRSSPVQVGTDTNWSGATFVNNGSLFLPFSVSMSAIKNDGSLWQWGSSEYTELALQPEGATLDSPVQIGTSSWISVGSTFGVTAAIRADGALFTWGVDDIQRIDYVGDFVSRSSPLQIGTSSWTMVCGGSYIIGGFAIIRADGTVHTWGYDVVGNLGTNEVLNAGRASPVQILSDRSFTFISGSSANYYAIATDNTVWAWGAGLLGRVGDNTIISRSSPVQVALPPL